MLSAIRRHFGLFVELTKSMKLQLHEHLFAINVLSCMKLIHTRTQVPHDVTLLQEMKVNVSLGTRWLMTHCVKYVTINIMYRSITIL